MGLKVQPEQSGAETDYIYIYMSSWQIARHFASHVGHAIRTHGTWPNVFEASPFGGANLLFQAKARNENAVA